MLAAVLVFTTINGLLAGMFSDSLESFFGVAVESPLEPEFDDVSTYGEAERAQVDAWLLQQMQISRYPSLSVAVVREGQTVYCGAFGFENIKLGRKAAPQTQYPVASVTKVFTASLAAQLHHQRVIDLDQPAVKYLPKGVSISTTPKTGSTITLRQLASHTSGLPRGIPGPVQSIDEWYQLEPAQLYAHLADLRLESAPGTKEEYSNLGFGLLGHALEHAAGKPFDQLVQEMICRPLRLTRTAIPVDDTIRPATGYEQSGWRLEKKESARQRLAPSGGLITTADELATFLAAQMQPGAFSKETLNQLHKPSTLTNGSPTGTALGWSVRSSVHVGTMLEKNGGRSIVSAWIGFSPEYRTGVAVITNCGGPDVDSMGRWLLERSVPDAHQPVTKHGSASVTPWTGVRWENDRPLVRIAGKWSPLLSVDGIPADRIVSFVGTFWPGEPGRKVFAENPALMLSAMGHHPKWNVTLGLQSSSEEIQKVRVRMTSQNRDLVQRHAREAAGQSENSDTP